MASPNTRGTPLIGFRCPPELRARMELRRKKREEGFGGEYTMSRFVMDCVIEVLDKPGRAKRSAEKKKAAKMAAAEGRGHEGS